VRIILDNHLPESTSMHWHGFEIPNQMDGMPYISQNPIPPGGRFVYEFDLHQHGTFFYHSHGAMQEMMGMIGMFIMHPKAPYQPTALTVVVGSPHLQVGTVQGNLEADLPQLDEPQLLDSLLKESPAIKIAQAELTRAEARLSRARREPIPDIEVKAGLQQNNEPLEGARNVGVQSFAEIKVQLHIFDRNQGNVAAAKGDVEKAEKELQRIDYHSGGGVSPQRFRITTTHRLWSSATTTRYFRALNGPMN
jgi:hypothetical protein